MVAKYTYYEYFLSFGQPFHSLNGVFWEAEVLDFDQVQVIHFFTYGQYSGSQEIFAYHKITSCLLLEALQF